MGTEDRGRPLPKFGEWDVNNPASADGFTVIFAKARDEKKGVANGTTNRASSQVKKNNSTHENITYPQGPRMPEFDEDPGRTGWSGE